MVFDDLTGSFTSITSQKGHVDDGVMKSACVCVCVNEDPLVSL